jgi:hypothetical protein
MSKVDGQPTARGFPSWATIPGPQWLAMARHWHLFFAWLFVINGIAYVLYTIFSRHLVRDLVPTKLELKNIGRSIVDHLKLKHPTGDAAVRYNVLQSLTYLIVIFGLLPLVVICGHGAVAAAERRVHRLGRSARRAPVGALAAFPRRARPRALRRRPCRRGLPRRRLERDALDDHRLVPGARGLRRRSCVMSRKPYTLMRAAGRDRRHLLRGAVAALARRC